MNFFLEATADSAQDFFMALHSGITPSRVKRDPKGCSSYIAGNSTLVAYLLGECLASCTIALALVLLFLNSLTDELSQHC